MFRTNRPKAFTLLELIVVVVVLGILAALAIPSFSTVKQSAADKIAIQSAESVVRNAKALASFDGAALNDTYLDQAGAELGVKYNPSTNTVTTESGGESAAASIDATTGAIYLQASSNDLSNGSNNGSGSGSSSGNTTSVGPTLTNQYDMGVLGAFQHPDYSGFTSSMTVSSTWSSSTPVLAYMDNYFGSGNYAYLSLADARTIYAYLASQPTYYTITSTQNGAAQSFVWTGIDQARFTGMEFSLHSFASAPSQGNYTYGSALN